MPIRHPVLGVPEFLAYPGKECNQSSRPPRKEDAEQHRDDGAGFDVEKAITPDPSPDSHGTKYSNTPNTSRQMAKNPA